MDVTSYIELVTVALAWKMYGDIVSLMYSLNLHLIPFAWIILKNWFETKKSQDAGFAAVTALKRNEIDIYSMIIVCVLFWMPNSATSITPSEANYHFQNNEIENEGATIEYKKEFLGSGQIDLNSQIAIPPGWWALFKFAKGMTYQLKSWTTLDDSLSRLIIGFSSAQITDQLLKSEVNDFYTACYSRTLSAHQSSSKLSPEVKDADISWIGNDLFVNTPGYYGVCTSSLKSKGGCLLPSPYWMPYKISERYAVKTGSDSNGNGLARPSCKGWWVGGAGDNYGLKDKLVAEALSNKGDSQNYVAQYLKNNEQYSDSFKDQLIKRLLTNSPAKISYIPELNGDKYNGNWADTAIDGVQEVVGAMGSQAASAVAQFMLKTLIPMLPMMQAVILLGMIVSLAIVQIIGGFSIGTTVKFIFAFIIVISWTFWWHLAFLLDEGLLRFMYSGASGADALFRSFSGTKQDVVWTIVTAAAYLILPGIWSYMLGIAGMDSATRLNSMMGDAKSGSASSGAKSRVSK